MVGVILSPLWIPFWPLLGFALLALFGRRIPKRAVAFLACVTVLISFFLSVKALTDILKDSAAFSLPLLHWFGVGQLNFSLSFYFDQLSVLMILIVTGVGFLIHVYSAGYMWDDEDFSRYFAYLNLFVFFMLVLVLCDSYLGLFVGWEGVGLSSYLLIGFWYSKTEYNNAAIKAFVMNRIGDVGFILAILLMVTHFGSTRFVDVFSPMAAYGAGDRLLTLITLLLFLGATAKSAQIPLYTWLPDAMAGPTPVSALIHAATMVTAGVYLVARSNLLFSLSPLTMNVVAWVGIATAVWAALIALTQRDIKKVLAYSTVSQLGYMVLALGLGAYSTAMFHLTTHAFFKALLFLAAGSVIHALHGEQDLSAMGGLRKSLPWTHLAFLTGTLAIVGAPPFSGFFSKEEILSVILARSPILFPLMWLVYILTAIYMFRLYFLCFWSDYRGKGKPHESAWTMRLSMAALSVLTLCGGVLNLPDAFGGKKMLKAFLAQSVLDMPSALVDAQTEWMLAALTAIVVAALGGLCYWYYVSQKRRIVSEEKLNWAAKLSYRKFYVDEIYDRLFVRPFAWLSETGLAFFDRRAIDPTLRLFGRASFSAGSVLRYVQNGGVNMYILLMSLGAALILLFGVLAK